MEAGSYKWCENNMRMLKNQWYSPFNVGQEVSEPGAVCSFFLSFFLHK